MVQATHLEIPMLRPKLADIKLRGLVRAIDQTLEDGFDPLWNDQA